MNRKLNCIMLIDDDEPTNFLSNMIIEEAGCTEQVKIEDSGRKAINYLVNSLGHADADKDYPWPDLILLDINMPAMNGWEFLERYNKLEKSHKSEITVIMLTTSLDPDDEIKAKDMAGVAGFKHKPLTEQMLKGILDTYFTYTLNNGKHTTSFNGKFV